MHKRKQALGIFLLCGRFHFLERKHHSPNPLLVFVGCSNGSAQSCFSSAVSKEGKTRKKGLGNSAGLFIQLSMSGLHSTPKLVFVLFLSQLSLLQNSSLQRASSRNHPRVFSFLGVFFFGVEERAAVVGLWVPHKTFFLHQVFFFFLCFQQGGKKEWNQEEQILTPSSPAALELGRILQWVGAS